MIVDLFRDGVIAIVGVYVILKTVEILFNISVPLV